MLQPENYPKLLGQALVLEPDPFVEMVDDDNPWLEGLFLTMAVGALVGIAQLIGGYLLTASLPDPTAMLEAVLQSWQRMAPASASPEWEVFLRQWWPLGTSLLHYGGGWARLLILVLTPLSWIFQWLIYGLVAHAVAVLLGGSGRLNQTLGATALAVAPRLLMLLMVVPFVSVSTVLLLVWGLLITYRGLEVAHELSPTRAALAAILPPLVLALLALVIGAAVALLVGWMGVSL